MINKKAYHFECVQPVLFYCLVSQATLGFLCDTLQHILSEKVIFVWNILAIQHH